MLWRQLADEAGEELVTATSRRGPRGRGRRSSAKFAPLVGEIAADLACGGAPPESRFTLAAHGG